MKKTEQRSIKFRAWFAENKAMTSGWELKDMPQSVMASLAHKSPCELMQFTGLVDRAGNDIFDGDIIQLTWHDPLAPNDPLIENSTVTFENGAFYNDDLLLKEVCEE